MKGGLLISLMRAKREDDDEEESESDGEEERAAADVRQALESGDNKRLASALRHFIEHCGG